MFYKSGEFPTILRKTTGKKNEKNNKIKIPVLLCAPILAMERTFLKEESISTTQISLR